MRFSAFCAVFRNYYQKTDNFCAKQCRKTLFTVFTKIVKNVRNCTFYIF
jgi:hypothetical protein